jgi:hypothetical protein
MPKDYTKGDKPPFMEPMHKKSLAWDATSVLRRVWEVNDPEMWDLFLDQLAKYPDVYQELWDRLSLRNGNYSPPEAAQ